MVPLGPHGARGEPGYQKPTWSPNCPLPHFSFSRGPWDMLSGLSGDGQLWTLGNSHGEGLGRLGLACACKDGRVHSPSLQCGTEDRAPR